MALATAVAWCVSYSPNRLGVASQFLDSASVFEAGDVARDCFVNRLAGFQVTLCFVIALLRCLDEVCAQEWGLEFCVPFVDASRGLNVKTNPLSPGALPKFAYMDGRKRWKPLAR